MFVSRPEIDHDRVRDLVLRIGVDERLGLADLQLKVTYCLLHVAFVASLKCCLFVKVDQRAVALVVVASSDL